jgi:hypothetical protein
MTNNYQLRALTFRYDRGYMVAIRTCPERREEVTMADPCLVEDAHALVDRFYAQAGLEKPLPMTPDRMPWVEAALALLALALLARILL